MHEIPDITVDREDIIIDEIRSRKPFFRSPQWSVIWRSINDTDLRGLTVLTRDVCAGMGALGETRFGFTINWREDLRRRVLFDDESMGEAVSDAVTEAVSIATSTAASFAEFAKDSSKTSY